MNSSRFFVPLIIISLFLSCKDDDRPPLSVPDTTYGREVSVGNGKVRSFLQRGQNGDPASFGLEFTEAALEGLPLEGGSSIVQMPAENSTMVDHITFDYAPHHHLPTYDTPQITTHFYFITQAEQNAIKVDSPDMDAIPPKAFWPKDHVPTPSGVAKIGKYWPDSTAEELHGVPFKRSINYGSYKGKFIFMEPMYSMAFLKSAPIAQWPVKEQPLVQQTGFYPASYAVSYNAVTRTYTLSFEDLKYKSEK